jgi:hypothetical protein
VDDAAPGAGGDLAFGHLIAYTIVGTAADLDRPHIRFIEFS